jgi:hypothetical protein
VPYLLRALFFPALVAGALMVATVGQSLADPDVTDIPPHRHYVRLADGTRVEVGPRVCDNPALQHAFNQFHVNTHQFESGTLGPVAPGLHNGIQTELTARGC